MPIQSAIRTVVTGRVQGVGFRAWAASRARRLGVKGWVRNRSDGSVELFAEGDASTLESFTEILKEGSPWSSVDRLASNPEEPRFYSDFSIIS